MENESQNLIVADVVDVVEKLASAITGLENRVGQLEADQAALAAGVSQSLSEIRKGMAALVGAVKGRPRPKQDPRMN